MAIPFHLHSFGENDEASEALKPPSRHLRGTRRVEFDVRDAEIAGFRTVAASMALCHGLTVGGLQDLDVRSCKRNFARRWRKPLLRLLSASAFSQSALGRPREVSPTCSERSNQTP